jgi:hypothetical protein
LDWEKKGGKKMIKLAVKVTNFGASINVGAELDVITHIISIEHPELEKLLEPEKWETKTISLVKEVKK